MILFFFPVSPQGRVRGRVESIIDYMYIHGNSTNIYYLHIYQTHSLGIFLFFSCFFSFFLVIIYPGCLPSALSLSQA